MFKTFKSHPLYYRREQSQKMKIKFPDRVPVILERYHNNSNTNQNTPLIDKNKYLVPKDSTVGNFMYILRQRLKLNEKQAMFLFFDRTLAPTSEIMSVAYEQHKDDDGFLYITYTTENTFG